MLKILLSISLFISFITTAHAFEPNRGNFPGTFIPRDYNFKQDLAHSMPYSVRYPKQANTQTCYTTYRALNNWDYRPQGDLVQGLARLIRPHSGRILYEPVYTCSYN